MRLPVFLFLILTLCAAGLWADDAPVCSAWGVGDYAREFGQALNFTAGGVDQCDADASGAARISCDEVAEADERSFTSSYNYVPGSGAPNFRACSPITSAAIVEDLHMQDMASAAADSLSCNLAFLNDYLGDRARPGQPAPGGVDGAQGMRLNRRAWDTFRAAQGEIARLTAIVEQGDYPARQEEICRGAGMRGSAHLVEDCDAAHVALAQRLRSPAARAEQARARTARDALLSSIPFGTEPAMREALTNLAKQGTVTSRQFLGVYFPQIRAIRNELEDFDNLLRGTAQTVQMPDGSTATRYLSQDCSGAPAVRARLLASAEYNALIQAKPNLSGKIKEILTCRRDSYQLGEQRVNNAILAASLASAVITGGTSLAGVAIGTAARGILIAADVAITGLDGVVVVNSIYDSCYGQGTGAIPRGGQQCSPENGLNMAITRADNGSCVANAISAAAPGLIAAGSIAVKVARRGASAGESAMAAADNTAGAARVADGAPATGTLNAAEEAGEAEITVTGTRGPLTREQREAREARREADRVAERRERALADENRRAAGAAEMRRRAANEGIERERRTARAAGVDVSGIRRRTTPPVTSENVAEVTRNSLRDKQSLDDLLRAAGVRNLNEAHEILNGGADGIARFLREHPGLSPAQRVELRTLHAQLVEERQALTRYQTERDLRRLDAEADTVEVNCATMNSLWPNPPFERTAGCRQVTFNESTERYCSCGAASGIGNWLLPCAENLDDYLITSQFRDVTATPTNSAFQVCRRVSIPAGARCFHGGLGPTMSGYGGAAQLICQGSWTESARTGRGRRGTRGQILEQDGIELLENPPPLEVRRIAVMHDDPGVTEILYRVRLCLENHNNLCPQDQIRNLRAEYNDYIRGHRSLSTPDQEELIGHYFRYAEGDMTLNAQGVFTEGSRRPPPVRSPAGP